MLVPSLNIVEVHTTGFDTECRDQGIGLLHMEQRPLAVDGAAQIGDALPAILEHLVAARSARQRSMGAIGEGVGTLRNCLVSQSVGEHADFLAPR